LSARTLRITRWILICAAVAIVIAFSSPWWLPWFGDHLVLAGEPSKSDAILVIAGDWSGNRILKGGELATRGFAPIVLVSGPDGFYGHNESDLAIPFAVKHGYPVSLFAPVLNNSRSTAEEAAQIIPELRRRGVHRFILVTSDTHTRRAGGVYRRLAKDLPVSVVAAPSAGFDIHRWWQAREGRKAILNEWMRTVADWFRI
jgi:uncharacterized SAM-binding protein YcdF (DUF218 family)